LSGVILNAKYQNLIETVQKQFLLLSFRGLNWETHRNLPSYVDTEPVFPQGSSDVNSSYLLGQIHFFIPVRSTRHFRPITLKIIFSSASFLCFRNVSPNHGTS